MTQVLTFRAPGQEPFDVELDDATWVWIEALCAGRGVTLDQLCEEAIESFLASHPIIAQTRTPQWQPDRNAQRGAVMNDGSETTNATDTPTADDMTLVALTPTDMGPAQANLAAWCDRKIAALRLELADLEANLQLATEHGWKYETVAATLARTERRITYYEKMQAAVLRLLRTLHADGKDVGRQVRDQEVPRVDDGRKA